MLTRKLYSAPFSALALLVCLLAGIKSEGQTTTNVTFAPYPIRSFLTYTSNSGVSVADFNGDGKLDIAVSQLVNSTVSVLLNTTNAQDIFFSEPITFTVGWEPKSLAAGDFDDDGKPDIITCNQADENLTYMRNIGDAGEIDFEISIGQSLGHLPQLIRAADLNQDDKLDIVIAHPADDLLIILKNTSSPGMIEFQVYDEIYIDFSTSSGLTIDDFDGDGLVDVAVGGSNIFILRNTSSPANISFAEPTEFTRYLNSIDEITSADYDTDGKIDIAIFDAGAANATITFMRNTSTPGHLEFKHEYFNEFPSGGGAGGKHMINCDINNDSKEDLAVTHAIVYGSVEPWEHNFVSVLINSSTPGSFGLDTATPFTVAEDPIPLTSADFDADGKVDLAIGGDNSESVSILHNRSTITDVFLNSASIYDIETGTVGGADFNGNGKPDVATANWSNDSITILRNYSEPNAIDFIPSVTYPTGENPNGIAIADFNNDAKKDIIIANHDDENLSIYRNESTVENIAFSIDSLDVASGLLSISTGDFNSDNKIDLVASGEGSSPDSIYVLRNTSENNDISFEIAFGYGGSDISRPKSSAVADFDGDGRVDIIIGNHGVPDLDLFRNESTENEINFIHQGNVTWSWYGIQSLACADVDGDSKTDLVVVWTQGDSYIGGCSILRNISTPSTISFAEPIDYQPLTFPASLALHDFTGDDAPDILMGDTIGHATILENNCTPGSIDFSLAFPGAFVCGDLYGVNNFFVADFDLDGYSDIATPYSGRNELWFIRTFNPVGQPILCIDPDNYIAPAAGGSETIIVSNCGSGGTFVWQTAENSDWITVEPISGLPGENFRIIVAENTGSQRNDAVTVTAGGISGSPQVISVTQEAGDIQSQTIPLASGWNMFSLAVEHEGSHDMLDLLSPILDDYLVKVIDEQGNTVEKIFGNWQNYIGDWQPTEGYYIKVSDNVDWENEGNEIETPFGIPLSGSWNMISYVCLANEQNALAVMQPLIDSGYLIKVIDEAGNTIEKIFGNWQNYIGNMKAGEGYYVKVTENCTLTETCNADAALAKAKAPMPIHFVPKESGHAYNPMSLYLRDVSIDGSSLQAGDEVAVYDGDQLVGSAVRQTDNRPMLLIASCADEHLAGFHSGDTISFKIWRKTLNDEYDVIPEQIRWMNLNQEELRDAPVFEELSSACLSINLDKTKTETPTAYKLYPNYPNPFNPSTTIAYDLPESSDILLEIYNAVGQRVRTLENSQQQAGHYEVVWDGQNDLGLLVVSGLYIFKVVCLLSADYIFSK